jgi:uncharacterized membrane protein
MNGDVPIQVVVAAFRDERAADEALKQLKEASREHVIKIDQAAVLRRDANNKLFVNDVNDMGGGKGAAIGGVSGAVIGLLAGPVGWGVALGALVGGLAAKARDGGFNDARLKQLGEGLKPGTSAIVAVVEHTWVREVEKELAEAGANVVTETLQKDIAQQLEAGHDVAITVLSAPGVVAGQRTAGGGEEAEVERFVATDQGVYVEGAAVDKDRIRAGAAVVTSEGGAAVTAEGPRSAVEPKADAPAQSGQQPAGGTSAPEKPGETKPS